MRRRLTAATLANVTRTSGHLGAVKVCQWVKQVEKLITSHVQKQRNFLLLFNVRV